MYTAQQTNPDALTIEQIFKDVDMDECLSHGLFASSSLIPGTDTIPYSSPSDVSFALGPDTCNSDATFTTSRSPSTSHNRLPDQWDIGEPDSAANVVEVGGWDNYTDIAGFGDEQFGNASPFPK